MPTTLRLILIGKTGNGKSTTGNCILGQEAFEQCSGLCSGTDKCGWKKVSVDKLVLEVTDTPGVCDTHKPPGLVFMEMSDLRIILIGKTGSGKSTTGNGILGEELFVPYKGLTSGTVKCAWKKKLRWGRPIQVTDTPGVCDTHLSPGEVEAEIAKCVATMVPGPDAILFVLRGNARFTWEEFEAFLRLKTVFGEKMNDYLMVVLTGITEEEFAEYQSNPKKPLPENFQKILQEAGGRCVCFSGKLGDREAEMLLTCVDSLKAQNGGQPYSNSILQKFDEEMTARAAEEGVTVDEVKEEVVEEDDPGFLGRLFQYLPSALTSNQYCIMM